MYDRVVHFETGSDSRLEMWRGRGGERKTWSASGILNSPLANSPPARSKSENLPDHETPEKEEMTFIDDEAPDACDEFWLLEEAEEPCRMTLNWLALFG